VKETISTAVHQDSVELSHSLPHLRQTILEAQSAKVTVAPEDLYELKAKLATVSRSSPDFWPTSLTLLSYLSQVSTGKVLISNIKLQTIMLDKASDHARVTDSAVTLGGYWRNAVVTRSFVQFDPNVILENVRFDHCVFVFNLYTPPNLRLQRIGDAMLATNNISDMFLTV
jgi:hypothetical protein